MAKSRSRYSGKKYMALLRQRRRTAKHSRKWARLGRKASVFRKRMIAANKGGHTTGKMQKCSMSPESKKLYGQLLRTSDGKAVAKRFKQFWKLSCPPSVKPIAGGPKGVVPLLGMGHTDKVLISNGQKGQQGKQTRTIKGRWNVATEKTGKHVILLTKRPMSGKLVFVGYAPETFYIPPPDIEKAGTHKAGFVWRHIHGAADGNAKIPKAQLVWPKVYADRGGKVDVSSNFVYGSTKHGRITTWMYH